MGETRTVNQAIKDSGQGLPCPQDPWDLVYLPKFTMKINHSCRQIYRSSHGFVLGWIFVSFPKSVLWTKFFHLDLCCVVLTRPGFFGRHGIWLCRNQRVMWASPCRGLEVPLVFWRWVVMGGTGWDTWEGMGPGRKGGLWAIHNCWLSLR